MQLDGNHPGDHRESGKHGNVNTDVQKVSAAGCVPRQRADQSVSFGRCSVGIFFSYHAWDAMDYFVSSAFF
jgi:hypothetical protein